MDTTKRSYEAKLMEPIKLVSRTVGVSKEALGAAEVISREASPFTDEYVVSRYPITAARVTGLSSIRDVSQAVSAQETERVARDLINKDSKSAEKRKIPTKRPSKSPNRTSKKSKSKSPVT